MRTVGAVFEFCYGHYLPDYPGKCVNQHGHTGKVEVVFTSCEEIPQYEGMVLDFHLIKKYVRPVIEKLDHKNLNDLIDVPTAENIVEFIVKEIAETDIGDCLVKVRLYESPTTYAQWEETSK